MLKITTDLGPEPSGPGPDVWVIVGLLTAGVAVLALLRLRAHR